MALVEQFLPNVLTEVPQCPEPVALTAIRQSLIQLCDEGSVWVEVTDAFPTIKGESVYDIDTPLGARVTNVQRLTLDGYLLCPTHPDRILRGKDALTMQGKPTHYYSYDFDTVTLWRVPDEEYEVVATVAYAPKLSINSVPDYLYDQYEEAIKCGSLARLMSQPSKMWTDMGAAQYHARMFAHAIDVARVEANKGRVRSNLMVAQRPFA